MSTKILGQDIQTQKYTTGGGTTAYTATVPNLTALYDGFAITVKMNATNTGSSTLNVNWLGAKTLKKPWVTNMAANDLLINSVYTFVYDLAQDFFFLPSLTTTTSTGWFGGWATSAYGLVDYVFANVGAGSQNFDNHYGLYESASAIYSFSFCTMGNWASNDDKSWLASILKIDKTTWENTIYRSTTFCVSNGSWASPDAYITEDAGIIYFGYSASTSNWYIEFDTATDTFWGYWATLNVTCSVVLIWNPSLYGSPQNTRLTAWAAPWTTPPIALSYWGYEYSFQQYTTVDSAGSDTAGSAITFLTRTGSIYEYNNVLAEIDPPTTNIQEWWLFFKSDGTKLYIMDTDLLEFDLSIAWDITSFTSSGTMVLVWWPTWLFFRDTGWFVYYCLWQTTDRVYRKALGTPRDITSWGATTNYNPTAQCNDVQWIWLNDTGTKMYLLDWDGTNWFGGTWLLYQYSLSTPRQISAWVTYDTVSFDFSSQDTQIKWIAFSTDWTKLFACGAASNTIYQYELWTAWDLSTATYGWKAFRNVVWTVNAVAFRPDMTYAYIWLKWLTSIIWDNVLEYIQI